MNKAFAKQPYITENQENTEDILREQRVRYRLELVQENNMKYDVELWYIYKKIQTVDITPDLVKSSADKINTLGSCCKQFFAKPKNDGHEPHFGAHKPHQRQWGQ